MDVGSLIALVVGKFPIVAGVLAVLGLLVVVGQAIVALTPTQKDDEAEAKLFAIPVLGDILRAIAAFAPIQKK